MQIWNKKKAKMENLINDDLDPSSSGESDSDFDNECDSETKSDKLLIFKTLF